MQKMGTVGTSSSTQKLDSREKTCQTTRINQTSVARHSNRSSQRGMYLATLLLRLGLGLAGLTVMLFAQAALSMSGHPSEILCDEAKTVSSSLDRVQCEFYQQPYIPPSARQNYPTSIIVPKTPPNDNSLKMVADLHGYTVFPRSCESDTTASPGTLLVLNCASHYPAHAEHEIDGRRPMGWWGLFGGINSNGYRLNQSMQTAFEKYWDSIDLAAGITLRGTSYGGTGSILQSIIFPDKTGQRIISVVHANIPHTLFVRRDPNINDGTDNRGHYFRDPAVKLAWGDFDPALADFAGAAASGKVSHIYYRINGGTNDDLGIVDLEFFRLCDRYKIACFGTWHKGGHNITEPGVNMPFQRLYDSPEQKVDLGILPVFTNSTANNWGERGHFNLGLAWDSKNIAITQEELIVPIRYRRHTDMGPLADQPEYATFDLSIRHAYKLRKRNLTLHWTVGDQSGTTRATKGHITLKNIRLRSSDSFTNVKITVEEQTVATPTEALIVYTRQPRARTAVPGSPIQEAANWQHASDVGRINGGLAEADLVLDDLKGDIEVIHDCTTSEEICLAQEGRVSPDGRKIIYSVGYGNSLQEVYKGGTPLGIYEIPALASARLWIYDLDAGFSVPVPNHPPGVIDRQPEWLDNDTIVFSSNAAGTYPYKNQAPMHEAPNRCFNYPYCVSQEYGYGSPGKSMQIWAMNIDGTDARNLTPHEQMALSPAVMTNGDIVYSCWNAHGNRSHDAATSIGPATSKNKWWLCRMDGNGADSSVVLNAHKTPTLKTTGFLPAHITGGEGRSQLRAVRSASEVFKGKLAMTNYYRSNHVGSMGIIFGMDYNDPHVEGCSTANCYPDRERSDTRPGSGRYVPSSLQAMTPYGTDQDKVVRRDDKNRAVGKAGYPAPMRGSEYLITHARGSCYEETLPENANRAWNGGEPTCQKAIYKVKVPMVTDPFDTSQMEMIAGGDEWQAFDARQVTTYQELYGQPLPDKPPALNEANACYLQVVDARKAELHSPRPYDWLTTLYEQCSTQGCAVNTENTGFHAANMTALTVYLPRMWDFSYRGDNEEEFSSTLNNMGHKSIAVLGSEPLKADGSVKMQVPCETPIMMAGTDANGLSIAHDEMLHSLRKGETRTCHGCHDGHSEERASELALTPLQRFSATLSAGTSPVMKPIEQAVTIKDIRPILETRCQTCHGDMNDNDGLLYSRLAHDHEQIDWPWMDPKMSPRGDFRLARPYTSKWVAKFARDSLLYWKCIGSRADGRTDAQYANDIDFGPAHNTSATAEECQLIGRWIDTGVQN